MARIRVCAALLAACACASPARGPLVGASEAWRDPPPEPVAQGGREELEPFPVWDSYAEAQRWPPSNSAPFKERGHQPEQVADVRVNEVARAAYAGLVTDTVFPDDSVLAELAHSELGSGQGLGMVKTAGSWRYFQLDQRGRVRASGALTQCERCHAQAPADHVFGLPRTMTAD